MNNLEDLRQEATCFLCSFVFVLFYNFVLQEIPKPSLALNGVGGKGATELMRHLR